MEFENSSLDYRTDYLRNFFPEIVKYKYSNRNFDISYSPTLLSNVVPGMPAFDDEIFGPVASIIPVKDEAETIKLANQTPFGLGGAVFTRDVEKGERIAANEIEAGCCFVNDFVRSDPRLPFGGIKESGYGRELSEVGIREFTNMKTVYIR